MDIVLLMVGMLVSVAEPTAVPGLDESTVRALGDAQSVQSFRLDPLDEDNYSLPGGPLPFESLGLLWHHHMIEQRRNLTDEETAWVRNLLLSQESYRPPGSAEKLCGFSPRHGLRFKSDEAPVDVLICLECSELLIVRGQDVLGGGGFDPVKGKLSAFLARIFGAQDATD